MPGGVEASLVVVHTRQDESKLSIELLDAASLSIVVLFEAGAFAEIDIAQHGRSACRLTALMLSSGELACNASLKGREARFDMNGAFVLTGSERGRIRVDVDHLSPDCSSITLVKGVASGSSYGRFEGLVYVAPDAQRTDSQQTSRNITLGADARIETSPQLEIYADDVKCSHGATVGQIDGEQLMYMRQRGLSREQAQRLHIEGFVGDVVMHSAVESLQEQLSARVGAKLENIR